MVSAKKAKFEGTVQPWGNSLGLRITRTMCELARITKGSQVEIEIADQVIIIKPKLRIRKRLKLPYTEAELVWGLTPAKAHADELPAPLASEIVE